MADATAVAVHDQGRGLKGGEQSKNFTKKMTSSPDHIYILSGPLDICFPTFSSRFVEEISLSGDHVSNVF